MYVCSKEGRCVRHPSAPISLNKCEHIVSLLFSTKLLLRSLQSTIFCSSLFPLPLSHSGLFLPPPSTPNLSPRTVCSLSLALSIFFTSFTCFSCLSHFSSLFTFSLSELCPWSASSPCSSACNISLLKSSRRRRRRRTISLSHFCLAFSISLRFSVWVLCSWSVCSPFQHKLFKSSTKRTTTTTTTTISLSTFSLDSLCEYVHDQCSLFLLQFKLLRFQQKEEEENNNNNNNNYKRACNLAGIC